MRYGIWLYIVVFFVLVHRMIQLMVVSSVDLNFCLLLPYFSLSCQYSVGNGGEFSASWLYLCRLLLSKLPFFSDILELARSSSVTKELMMEGIYYFHIARL